MKRILLFMIIILSLLSPVSAADGDLGNFIDSLTYYSGQIENADILQITNDIYAIAYTNEQGNGMLKTVRINPNGQIDDVPIDTLTFDSLGGRWPKIIQATTDNTYIILYSRHYAKGSPGPGFMKTVRINSNGQIDDTPLDELQLDQAMVSPQIARATARGYAIAYAATVQVPGTYGYTYAVKGFTKLIEVNENGQITDTPLSTLLLTDDSSVVVKKLIRTINNAYAVLYNTNSNNDPGSAIKTIAVAQNGQISVTDSFMVSKNSGNSIFDDIVKVTDSIYTLTLNRPMSFSSAGGIRTIRIGSDSAIQDTYVGALDLSQAASANIAGIGQIFPAENYFYIVKKIMVDNSGEEPIYTSILTTFRIHPDGTPIQGPNNELNIPYAITSITKISPTVYAIVGSDIGTVKTFNILQTPAPTCSITANPATVTSGQSSTLTITVSGTPTSVVLDGTTLSATGGTKSVSPAQTTTFTGTVTNNAGTSNCQATVTVNQQDTTTPAPTETNTQPQTTTQTGTDSLRCGVRQNNCETSEFPLLKFSNGHASFQDAVNQYQNFVCCSSNGAVTGVSTLQGTNLNTANGFVRLSNSTNAHLEIYDITNPVYDILLKFETSGQVTCVLRSACDNDEACLFSLSNNTNAHVGNCNAFSNKNCCSVQSTSVPGGTGSSGSGGNGGTGSSSSSSNSCNDNNDCTSPYYPRCQGSSCVGCTNSLQCSKFSLTNRIYCNTGNGKCIECLDNTQCTLGDICDLSDNICKSCDNTGLNRRCPTGRTCNINRICVPNNTPASCTSDSQCTTSDPQLRCLSGQCRYPPPTPPAAEETIVEVPFPIYNWLNSLFSILILFVYYIFRRLNKH